MEDELGRLRQYVNMLDQQLAEQAQINKEQARRVSELDAEVEHWRQAAHASLDQSDLQHRYDNLIVALESQHEEYQRTLGHQAELFHQKSANLAKEAGKLKHENSKLIATIERLEMAIHKESQMIEKSFVLESLKALVDFSKAPVHEEILKTLLLALGHESAKTGTLWEHSSLGDMWVAYLMNSISPNKSC
jgi:hypothetical protein